MGKQKVGSCKRLKYWVHRITSALAPSRRTLPNSSLMPDSRPYLLHNARPTVAVSVPTACRCPLTRTGFPPEARLLGGNPSRPANRHSPSNWPLLPSHPHLSTKEARGSGTSSPAALAKKPSPSRPLRPPRTGLSSPHGLSHPLFLLLPPQPSSSASPKPPIISDAPCSAQSIPSHRQTLLFFCPPIVFLRILGIRTLAADALRPPQPATNSRLLS